MGEILFLVLMWFLAHPWAQEAIPEVDRIGTYEQCAEWGLYPDIPMRQNADGYWEGWLAFVDSAGGPVSGVTICWWPQGLTLDVEWLYGGYETLFWHELGHVYEAAVMGDFDRGWWQRQLRDCPQWYEVQADIFAYSVTGQLGVAHETQHVECGLPATPPGHLVRSVGYCTHARGIDDRCPLR